MSRQNYLNNSKYSSYSVRDDDDIASGKLFFIYLFFCIVYSNYLSCKDRNKFRGFI